MRRYVRTADGRRTQGRLASIAAWAKRLGDEFDSTLAMDVHGMGRGLTHKSLSRLVALGLLVRTQVGVYRAAK